MSSDNPDQGYYPSWKVRLTVRLEEFDSGVLARKVPSVPTKNLKGIKVDRAPLVASPDPDFPGRFLLKPKVSKATLDDAIKNYVISDSSSDGLTQVISGVIPKKFDWRQNGFRTADEFKCTLRWCDFPIDPRVIRACAVEFYLGTLTPVEYAQGMRGLTRGDVFGGNASNADEPMSVVPDGYLDASGNRRSNLRFTGWVDKWKMSLNDEEPSVDLECRDNTMLLLGQNAPPQLVLGMKDPIDLAIATYLSNFPQFAGLTVEYRGTPGDAVPKLLGTLAGTAFRPHLGPQPGQGAGDDLVVWDYLTDIAGSIGHCIRIDGNAIIIQRAATLLHGDVSARNDDSYRGRTLSIGAFPARAFIYGRNVSSFEVARDMANGETKNVEVRCYSSRRKQVLVARFPEKKDRVACSTPGDARADNKWTIVRVSGIENPLVLKQIAEDVFHGRNRNEIEVAIKTKNLASFGGGNEDPDLLDIKSGDAVEVLTDRSNPGTAADAEAKMTAPGVNEAHLKKLGFSPEFAAAYAKVYAHAGFQRFYRVKEMSTSGDVNDGVSFEIRACNFIQARGDVPPGPPGAAAPASPNAGSTASQGGGKNPAGAAGVPRPPVTTSAVAVTDAGGKAIKGVTSTGGITIAPRKK